MMFSSYIYIGKTNKASICYGPYESELPNFEDSDVARGGVLGV